MRYFLAVLCVLASADAMAATPRPAEPGGPSTKEARPWAEGVSQAEQDKATKLFDEATDLLKDAFFKRAVDLYTEALTHWDHPAIHFNIAKALMNLDDPAAAYTHLLASMKFGGEPLTPEQKEQVQRFTKLLYETELADVVIETEEPGAKVTLDGVELFMGPGRWKGVVRPETTKTLLATKLGYETLQIQPVILKKGQVNTFKLEMTELTVSTKMVHKFDTWIPWVVLGSGVAILGGGALMTLQTTKSFDDYDKAVAACNAAAPLDLTTDAGTVVPGAGRIGTCKADASINDKKSQGETFQTLSIVGYAVGGAAFVTGIILFAVNTEHPVTEESPSTDMPMSVVPYVGPNQAGLTATFGF